MTKPYIIYCESKSYDFDGVNWVEIKPKPDSYIMGYRGWSYMEEIDPLIHIYCPYIPLCVTKDYTNDSSSKQV